jgi:hypothetical protein
MDRHDHSARLIPGERKTDDHVGIPMPLMVAQRYRPYTWCSWARTGRGIGGLTTAVPLARAGIGAAVYE